MLKRPNYVQLLNMKKKFDIYFLASGGKDSTAMVLEAYTLGIKGTMIHNDTCYNQRHAPQVLKELVEITGFSLIIAKYDGAKPPGLILRESFQKIPKTVEWMKKHKRYSKKFFRCCNELKHNPTTRLMKSLDPKNALLMMGIKGTDGSEDRRMRLAQLRNRRTFFRYHKTNGLLYYYPLRDTTKSGVVTVLAEYNLENIKSTGCTLCPVFVVTGTKMMKNDILAWKRSHKFARTLDVHPDKYIQTDIRAFCTGMPD